ncbi:hypothetical protein AMATHDRAFT_66132 [Amanita thiersii Skay4041]|uniref:Uncharacterized protein n=1 Tax=Amanita thiersii Skay4041 TaxID=703135 RepID=A0A2A9NKD5_9AGAR|nr:hypothetical protein AMATHDRAFT_66132 [Amanita thiersii Skay4041]
MDHLIIDDVDPNIVYSPGWVTAGSSSEFNNTVHGTQTAGARVTYTFRGSFISVFGTLGSDQDSVIPNATFSVDYSAPLPILGKPTGSNQYKHVYFQSGQLTDDEHTLSLTPTAQGALLWVDFFLVTPSTNRTTKQGTKLVKVDDNDSIVEYSGNWTKDAHPSDFQSTTHFSQGSGSSASFSYFGTSVTVYGRVANTSTSQSLPAAVFTVDDGVPTAFNPITPPQESTLFQVPLYRSPDLPLGPHTVKVQSRDNLPVYLDFFMFEQPANLPSTVVNVPGPTTSATTPTNSGSSGGGGTASVGAVVGGVIAGIIAILAMMFLAFWIWRRKAMKSRRKMSVYLDQELPPRPLTMEQYTINPFNSMQVGMNQVAVDPPIPIPIPTPLPVPPPSAPPPVAGPSLSPQSIYSYNPPTEANNDLDLQSPQTEASQYIIRKGERIRLEPRRSVPPPYRRES